MNIHINDRSRLDEVIALGRDTDGKYTIKRTLRMALEDAQRSERGWYAGRRDVVLINGIYGKRDYTLEVAENEDIGYAGDTWILNILDAEQHALLNHIAYLMRENAKEFPPAKLLLNRS